MHREFDNLQALHQRGVPCPPPVAVGRRLAGGLIRESILIERFLAGTKPLSHRLLQNPADRAALLDAFVRFLLLLREKKVVHKDLHWHNVLVRSAGAGHELFVVDAMHVEFADGPGAAEDAAAAAVWFAAFLISENAPRDILDGFLDRLPQLYLGDAKDRTWVLKQAGHLAEKL
jgi:hypothetical protein